MLQYAQHPPQFFGTTQCTDSMVDNMEIDRVEEEECNVPTLKSLCQKAVIRHIAQFRELNLPNELLEKVLSNLRQAGKLDDNNITFFAPLSEVDVSGNPISDNGIRIFAQKASARLRSINLEGLTITDSSILSLAKQCAYLEGLYLGSCAEITDSAFRDLTEHCTKLSNINIKSCHLITDQTVERLATLPNLKHMILSNCYNITDSSAQHIINSEAMRQLVEVSFSGCTNISTAAVKRIVAHCSANLQFVRLDYCTQFVDDDIRDILSSAPSLRAISLSHLPRLTNDVLSHLEKFGSASLETVELAGNVCLDQPQIKSLAQKRNFKLLGGVISINILRNHSQLKPLNVSIDRFSTAEELAGRIQALIANEEPKSDRLAIRRVTYRKNGTLRPSTALQANESQDLISKLLGEKKKHLFLDQSKADPRDINGHIFITIKQWNVEKKMPEYVCGLTVPSTMMLRELKSHLTANYLPKIPADQMIIVEEETELRVNILLNDSLPLSMYGLISGDILHAELISPHHFDNNGFIAHSFCADYYVNQKVKITVQETDESFIRRAKHFPYLASTPLKFDISVKGTVRLSKLQEEIAALTGVEGQYQRLSTRVEPHIWIRGSSKRIVEALSGNLWLLLDVDSNKMDADKMAIPVTLFKPSSPQPNDAQLVVIERRATFLQLKEKLAKLFNVPEQRQLLTEVQQDPVMQITYYKRLFTNDNAVLGFTNIKTIRLLELESPNLNPAKYLPNELIVMQLARFWGWDMTRTIPCMKMSDPELIIVPVAHVRFVDFWCNVANKFNVPSPTMQLTCSPIFPVYDNHLLKLTLNGMAHNYQYMMLDKFGFDHLDFIVASDLSPTL